MMKIKNIYNIGVALLLAGCSNETELTSNTLSGGEKTPLRIAASLNSGNAITRAANDEFKSGDQLLAYIRHIRNTDATDITTYNSITADQAPKLVTFTKGSAAMADANPTDNIKETTDLTVSYTSGTSSVTALYWDDFSVSDDTPSDGYGDFDLRTANHGLQSYYGYCYNGKTGLTLTNEAAGTLTWTVATDQRASATTVQNQDLLWSPAQTAVTYAHSTAVDGDHNTLTIPYTHAMSEITVKVTALQVDGFTTGEPLKNTVLTLNQMNTSASLTAPTSEITSSSANSVIMYGDSYESGETRNYTAIVAPGTKLKVDAKLLDIVNVENNDYILNITSTMVAANTAWGVGHTVKSDDGIYILTQPGYNYHLDVTVKKAAVDVKATLANWITVNASGTGEIQLDDDNTNLYVNDTEIVGSTAVQVINMPNDKFFDDSSFSLFWSKAASAKAAANTSTTNDSYTFATVSTYDDNNVDPDDIWENNPPLYWPNKKDNYYFRALAKYNSSSTTVKSKITSVGTYNPDNSLAEKGTTVEQGTVTDDGTSHDMLWGTTPLHYGKDGADNAYQRGMAIPPRKGGVPIAFFHAMSKIKFVLETTSDASVSVNNASVNLTDAKVTVSGIYTEGTISIEDGTITTTGSTGSTAALNSGDEYCVIPQDFSSYTTDAMVTVTLNDGSIYKVKLKDCIVTSTKDNQDPTEITKWERGKHYVYTIHLEKEQITFRALIKDWEETTGSGNANLEWD